MVNLEPRGIGDRPRWVLRLLHAPVKGRANIPIVGMTRLMKGCFLVHRKTREEHGIETDFEFHPDDYGPLDPRVYDTVDYLEQQGLLTEEESDRYEGVEFELTRKGQQVAQQEFKNLDEDVQSLISWIKGKHVLRPLPKLLSFVYNQYPRMAKNSKIA